MKKKVLVWADTPYGSTGFSTVSKNILKEMYATGEYEFDCVAINGTGLPYDQKEFPYMIYPAISALAQDPKFRDPYGRHLMLSFLGSGKYDLLFIIQDTFIVQTVIEAINTTWEKLPKAQKFATIYYFPIDATPHRDWVTKVVSECHYPVAYTEYAKRECMKFDPSLKRMPVIYHGASETDFHPLSVEERKAFRETFFKGKENDFIVLNVSRNQPRKDLHKTFAAFSIFHKDHPNSFLYILAQCQDVGGDLIEIAKNYGLEYEMDWGCPAPGTYGANSGYPVEMVNKIYASADVVVTTTLGEGFGLCLHPETKVYTEKGIKEIQHITITDKVLSSDGKYNDVLRVVSSEHDEDMYEITSWLSNIPVKASGDHPFAVLEDDKYVWKNARDLSCGDQLLFPRKYVSQSQIEIDILEFLWPYLTIRQQKNVQQDTSRFRIQSNFKCEENWIPRKIIIDKDFCKMLGLYLAEGCVPSTKKDSILFSFHKNEIKEMAFVGQVISSVFGIQMKERPTKRVNYNGMTIIGYSSVVATFFSILCGEGARNKKLHSMFLGLDAECATALLHGFFIGDGSYTKTTHEFTFSTTSMNIAYSLRLLMARLGIASSVRTSRVEYKVSVSGSSKERILELFGEPYRYVKRSEAMERTSMNEDFLILPIKNITTRPYKGKMVDIEVAETKDFVAENVVVHNCTTEAFRAKTSLIAPRNTSLIEIVGENEERGYFCNSGETLNDWVCLGAGDNNLIRPTVDVYNLAEKMCYVFDHPEEAQKKVEAAFEWVPSWKQVCKQWEEVFKKACKKIEDFRK